jgi:MOSC domain-containing protein YiiM
VKRAAVPEAHPRTLLPVLVVSQVFVGQPSLLGEQRGRPVMSGIRKHPATSDTLTLGETGLEGDGQADLRVHGGVDKAVYVYPAEHYPAWEGDGFALTTTRVGENVSSRGRTEADVRVGDVWRWGEALVQVSQPRAPCFKFGMHTGRKDAIKAMQENGRCGWYVRVLETGSVPTTGSMELVESDAEAPTIAALFAASFPKPGDGTDLDEIRRMIAIPTLADPWRHTVASKLARLDA